MKGLFAYIFNGFKNGKDVENTSEKLFLKALVCYCRETGLKMDFSKLEIKKNKKGKPYIKDSDLHYNISHSDKFWVCVISNEPVGIDIQIATNSKFEKISKRYFTDEENDYVIVGGKEAFFQIWTIKEAYTKFLGESIFNIIDKVETVKNGLILNEIRGVKIKILDLSKYTLCENLKCTVAFKKDEEICIRTLI